MDEITWDHQFGIRKDQIFCIPQILDTKWQYNETVHQLLIDVRMKF
jgi:hypothetical protein